MIKVNSPKQCDILIVGGGTAGLMAAVAAAERGARVIVAEKADTRRSGGGATGNDHFACYIPGYHESVDSYMHELEQGMCKGADPRVQRVFAERSFEIVKDWGKWGINMRPFGDEYVFEGHTLPGHPRCFLKIDGRDQKKCLTNQARRCGVMIDNRTSVTRYISREGRVVGAIAIDISRPEPEITLYEAKSIISVTGTGARVYPAVAPSCLFNVANCPAGTGTGRVASYEIGAVMVNFDKPRAHIGPRYFVRGGKGTWIGACCDAGGNAVGIAGRPEPGEQDITTDICHEVFDLSKKNGTGPVFMDCTENPKDTMEHMKECFYSEGISSLLDAMEQQDIHLEEDMIEWGRYLPHIQYSGTCINEKCETSTPGLYSAGDECGNFFCGVSGAAVTGRIAGESASEYIKGVESFTDIAEAPEVLEAQRFYSSLMEREEGSHWEELNHAVQNIMRDYASIETPRSETLLSCGVSYLEELNQIACKRIKCANSHELMRTLEAFDILALGRLILLSALARKESRGLHKRVDYPYTNPLWNSLSMTIKKMNGKDYTEMQKL